jgi:group I intron endonuclease
MIKNGVYQIRHLISGKRYIGSAASDGGFAKRWNEHRLALSKTKHHSIKLQRAWNKHGAGTFVFEVLLYCDPENCLMYEQLLMNWYKPEYNICMTAGNTTGQTPFLGKKHNSMSRRKISIAKTGTHHSEDSKRKMSLKKKGVYGGENHPRAKLCLDDVNHIRELLQQGYTQQAIADTYGVSRVTISHIKCGRTWL